MTRVDLSPETLLTFKEDGVNGLHAAVLSECGVCGQTFGSWFALACHLAYFDFTTEQHIVLPPKGPRGRKVRYDDDEHRKDSQKKRRRYLRRKMA